MVNIDNYFGLLNLPATVQSTLQDFGTCRHLLATRLHQGCPSPQDDGTVITRSTRPRCGSKRQSQAFSVIRSASLEKILHKIKIQY